MGKLLFLLAIQHHFCHIFVMLKTERSSLLAVPFVVKLALASEPHDVSEVISSKVRNVRDQSNTVTGTRTTSCQTLSLRSKLPLVPCGKGMEKSTQ